MSGLGPVTLPSGVDPARVAEVIVDRGPGVVACRGSGSRVTATAVLAAAHVVQGGIAGWVRFSPDEAGEWAAPLTRVVGRRVGGIGSGGASDRGPAG